MQYTRKAEFLARAKRHYIPGHAWHLTHRCHKREFLFKFAKDRNRWLHWLYLAKKDYGLIILNYTVTSNHIHLLVYDNAGRMVIPKSIQLLAGRVGREYNIRKKRSGAFWEDRYHATAVETGEHLLKCIIYIDLNMIRTGTINHPSEWFWSGYNEIQAPRRKKKLISYDKLSELAGFDSYEKFQIAHREWVKSLISSSSCMRESMWTESIAVGTKQFASKIYSEVGPLAKGRKIIQNKNSESFQIREEIESYNSLFDGKKYDIENNNAYFWNDIAGFPGG